MQTDPITRMAKPFDPREQAVIRLGDYPDPPLTLVSSRPRIEEAATEASTHLARQAQHAEREQAITANLEAAADDLHSSQLLDSQYAAKVAAVLPADLPLADRRQAGAVAVRLHDPNWQMVSRYRAADAILLGLRNLLSAHGLSCVIADSDLRAAADRFAGAAQVARMRTWDGSDPVKAKTWARAKLGILSLTEDR